MPYTCVTPNGIALQAVIAQVTSDLAAQVAITPQNTGLISSLTQQLNLLQMELVDYCMINETAVMSPANILTVM